MAKEEMSAAIEALGITMLARFVPWSQSRNKDEKRPSLNWRVTITHNGRDILTADYGAGSGHCPAYKASVKEMGGRDSIMRDAAIRYECEHGHAARVADNAGSAAGFSVSARIGKGEPIHPDICDVVHSLVSDGAAINHPTYESWAADYGFDEDSRKGETIYRACLDIGLKLRAALGEDGFATLRAAAQDY